MSKVYFENDISTPEGLTREEQTIWHYRMVGGAGMYIEPKIWKELRWSCEQAILNERKQEAPNAHN